MADTSPEKGARPSRLWRVVLVISLALNLAVAGAVIGAYGSGKAGEGPPRSFDIGQGPLARALTPRERLRIVRELRQERVLRGFDFRGHFTSMIEILSVDPLDEAALRALMDEQVSRTSEAQASAQGAFLSVILSMTPERRAEFAAQLEQEVSRPRRHGPRPSGG